MLSLNDVWEFTIAGALAPNVPDGVLGSWRQISFSSSNLPSVVGLGSAVLPGAVITTYGGCTTPSGNDDCAQQVSSILNANNSFVVTSSICPAPRLGPSVVANRNLASSAFDTQAFVFLGTFNTSLWDDGGNLKKGEVVCAQFRFTVLLFTFSRTFLILLMVHGFVFFLLEILAQAHPSFQLPVRVQLPFQAHRLS